MSGLRPMHNLALIGFMGTGKSSVGRCAAQQLGFEFVDTDDQIEQRTGRSVPELFAEEGEVAFRQREEQLVTEMIDWRKKVIATGGGLAAVAANLASLQQHSLVVCLWATPEVIWERVRHQRHRPLLQGPEPMGRIRELLRQRTAVYRQADVLIHTGVRSVREVAQQVVFHFHSARSQASRREAID